MDSKLEPAKTVLAAKDSVGVVTSRLFEAFMACPMKCYLLSKGEISTGSEYASWVTTQTESYCSEGKHKLTAEHPHELYSGTLESGRWKNGPWYFALDKIVQTQNWEASLHLNIAS